MTDLLIGFFIFVSGLAVGSFLNVCIVRMPQEKSVVFPGSHCVRCQKPIPWYDNIPLVSYIILLGRCRFCKEKISIRYFIVELLTGSLFLCFYLYFGLVWKLLAYLILLSGLIVATFIDIEHRIIPDEISLGGIVVGLLLSFLLPGLHETDASILSDGSVIMRILAGVCVVMALALSIFTFKPKTGKSAGNESSEPAEPGEERENVKSLILIVVSLLIVEWVIGFFALKLQGSRLQWLSSRLSSVDASLIGFLIGGCAIYAMGLLGDLLFKKESMGGGDVKLLAMIGAFLGWKAVLLTFFLAPVFGAVVGVVVKIRTKESIIPYGPFLALGALISLFWSERIIALWIQSCYGLYRM